IIVVGAGNSAIEAAVDLVAKRQGDRITFRPDSEINDVTLVIRSDMKNDLKFGNKQQVYDCIDEGKIKVFFGTSIKEIRDGEVVLMNARTQEVKETVPNDFIFAMIGGDRPTKFLESIGIKIG
ncbi:MAG TPA: NAD(P)-binding domain-containing protein, partial [Pyrinomonadaceae bacterium]